MKSRIALAASLLAVIVLGLCGRAAAETACPSEIPVVEENACSGAGSEDWRLVNPNPAIAGFATRTSVDKGEDVVLKIGRDGEEPGTTTADVNVYRIGYYGGEGGALIPAASQESVVVNNDQKCEPADPTTGLLSCANWDPTYTIPGESLRASGLYVAHIKATDTGWDNQIVFVVRDDERASQAEVLLQIPLSTYEAYNDWGGKSLYDFNSSGKPTVSGSQRAVKVSFERPFANTTTYSNDWFLNADLPLIFWLERQGYDISYTDDRHTHADPSSLLGHHTLVLGGHDEYWSEEEFKAVKAARDAGVDVASFGANTAYWKVRYEDGNNTLVCYKTVQGSTADGSTGANDWGPDGIEGTADDALGADGIAGTADDRPENSTTTFRDDGAPPGDPNAPPGGRVGPNMPENSLFGTMYFGDRDGASFPLEIPAGDGDELAGNDVWRHTGIAGGGGQIDSRLVGWEWDAVPTQPQYLSQQPAGVEKLTESEPESTNWLQDEGRVYGPTPPPGQPAVANTVRYTAPSGAIVFAAGTDQWSWGLGPHFPAGGFDGGRVDFSDSRLEQATANIFADMGLRPHTPDGIVLDGQNESPKASFTATPSPAHVGETVSFDASASTDPDGAVAHYEWDLDGNGSFETDTGTTPSAEKIYTTAAVRHVKLRVTDDGGATDTVQQTLSIVALTGSSYAEAVLNTEGLIHYWRLGESAGSTFNDVAANADATTAGATLGVPGALDADPDTAAGFAGPSTAAAPVNLSGTDKLTIEFWLNWNQFADDDALALELTENFNSEDGGILVDPDSSSNGGGRFEVAIGRGSSRNNAFFERPSAGAYHHYAFVIDTSAPAAEQITPYIDGAPVPFVKSVAGSGAGNFADALLHFMSRAGSALFGAGDLDELALYSRALSPAQIKAHYELGSNAQATQEAKEKEAKEKEEAEAKQKEKEQKEKEEAAENQTPYAKALLGTEGLIHYWRLGESAGSTFNDVAANADATTAGATLGVPGALDADPDTAAGFAGPSTAAAPVNLSGTDKLTIEFWLNWNQFADDDALALELTENFNSEDGGILVDPDSSSNGGGRFEVAIGRGSSRNNAFFERPSAGAYHHYAFVIDTSAPAAEQITPYIDGAPVPFVKSVAGSGAGNFADALLHFMSRAGSALFGAGDLDELALYSRALSPAQIKAHYELGSNAQATQEAKEKEAKEKEEAEAKQKEKEQKEKEEAAENQTPYAKALLGTEGLIHYWRLGESAGSTFNDVAANADATTAGATLGVPGALDADPDTAAGFAGPSTAAAPVNLSGTDKLTIEFWLNWNQFADDDALALELTENFNSEDGGILVDPDSSSNGGGRFEVAIGRGSSRNNAFFERPSAGAYHHYAFVIDTSAPAAEQITPYIDGAPVPFVKSVAGSGAGNFADALLHFMSRAGSALFGAGDLDELALYSRALSPAQIKAHYELGSGSGGG